jgi:hypothetical protein
MSRDRKILLAAGIIVLATFIFGYAGLYSRLTRDPYYDLKQECYYLIDHAQLWYSRPSMYDGGGGSFSELDFDKIGVSDQPNSFTWSGKQGFYTISELQGDRFNLLVRATNGQEFEIRDIYFDTRPVVEKHK